MRARLLSRERWGVVHRRAIPARLASASAESSGELVRAAFHVDEPFDLSLTGWIGLDPEPSNFMDGMFAFFPTTGFLDRTRLGRRLRAASRLSGAARVEAYAALDRDISARAASFATYLSGVRTDFFSARMGCQVEHPLYGIDLAALCVRE